MDRVLVIENPMAKYLLTVLRDKRTSPGIFRSVLEKVGFILGYELAKLLSWEETVVETPLARAKGVKPIEKIYIVGILGASIPMVRGLLEVYPWAGVGLIAARRFEKENTVDIEVYYERILNDLREYTVVIADPMLATGYTMNGAINIVKKHGGKKIFVLTVISSKQGLEYILDRHKDVMILTLSIDPSLNERWFIVPGLGDAGDRSLDPDNLMVLV